MSISNGFSSLTAHRITRTSQSCPLGTRDHLTLLLLQSPHPTISACSLCCWVQPLCDPTSYVVLSFPGLWIYVTNTLSSSSSFQGHGHMSGDSHNPRAGIPPSPTGWKGSYQNMWISIYFCKFTFTDCSYIHIFNLWTKDQNVELLIKFQCSLLFLILECTSWKVSSLGKIFIIPSWELVLWLMCLQPNGPS